MTELATNHGTYTRYTRGCKCDACKQAGRDYRATYVVTNHSDSGYAKGCRCEVCGLARMERQRRRRGTERPRPSKYDTPTPPEVIDRWRDLLGGRGT